MLSVNLLSIYGKLLLRILHELVCLLPLNSIATDPVTVREILSELVTQIMSLLSGSDFEQQDVSLS